MRFNALLILILLYLLVSCTNNNDILSPEEIAWLKQNDTIKMSFTNNYPPYQFVDEYGDIDGVFIDYISLIEKKINHKFQKIIYDDWSESLEDARKGKIDIIVEIQKTDNRESYLNFYAQLFDSKYVIVTNKSNSKSKKIKDFYDKKIVLPKDFAIVEIINSRYPGIQISTKKNELDCLYALSSGDYDVYIGPKAVVNYFIKTKNLTNLQIVSEIPYSYKPGISVAKDNIILNSIIGKAVRVITKREEKEIYENWLFNEVKPFYQNPNFWIIVVGTLLLILVLISIFNRYLNFKVKKRTQELEDAMQKAEESNKVITNFINNISHEIRTPMNGVLGFSNLLKNKDLSSKESIQYLDIVIQSATQLLSTIDHILHISKLRTNQIKINLENTNLSEVFENNILLFKEKAIEKNLVLTFKKTTLNSDDAVSIDKLKLINILTNLTDNAIKFTSKGNVTIFYELKEKTLKIEIEDTGIGIKEDNREIIFKSFSQLEKEISKKYSGLGLGLTIVKENVAIIGGKISFNSKENQGSKFIIELPYYPVKNELPIEEIDANQQEKVYTVLVAEDVKINFMLVNAILQKFPNRSIKVYHAINGKEAVEICEETKNLDLVLMDIRMPIMDGYEATRAIKKLKPNLPVIAHTAYATDQDITNALEAGCDNVIAKPLNATIFTEIIENYIEKDKTI